MHAFLSRARRFLLSLMAFLLALFAVGCDMLPSSLIQGNTRSRAGIRFNEAVASNARSLTDERLGSPDWIELYNDSDRAVNLSGCGLSDNLRQPRKYVFPDVTVQPGEYLVVYAAKYEGELPPNVYCTGFGLSKGGESLYFTDRHVNILDELTIPALIEDVSYARHEEGWFGFTAVTTPGAENAFDTIMKTLEEVAHAAGEGALTLSEVMPNNRDALASADGRRYPWAELHNPASEAVRLSEYWLSDDPATPRKWQLPDELLPPGAYALVFFSDKKGVDGELHARFKLGSEDGALYLSNAQGLVVETIAWELPALENVAVLPGNVYTAYPTPGAANDARTFETTIAVPMDESDPIIISEVLVKNRYSVTDADGDRPEWVELVNRSSGGAPLAGYYLTDDANRPLKWALPDIALGAGEYLLVFLSGKDRREGELHASFGLSEKDEVLQLVRADGMRVDSVALPPDIPENVSITRDEAGAPQYHAYPTPRQKNDSASFPDYKTLMNAVDGTSAYISEVSAVSTAKSGKADWIELHNPLAHAVDLAGWMLSDDIDALDKHVIKALTIPANGYAVINASTRTARQKEGMAKLGISSGGEALYLTDPAGILRDRYDTGALRAGITSGRGAEGTRVFYTAATPASANAEAAYPGYASPPAFSNISLYQSAPMQLTLTSATEGAHIYYTLDGSPPTPASSLYEAPLTIDSNTVVRAIAAKDGLLESDVVTHTYLFEQAHTVPVLCISGNQSDINAVYAATEKKQRVEREAMLEYFEPDGRLGVATPIGMRASGASTLTYAQKSFALFIRGGYGRSSVTYPFFENYHINTFSSLTIRNSGQDWTKARLRDSYFSLASEGLYIDNVATRPVVLYLNGKYWGVYDLNENQNEEFLASHYGVDRDAVDIIRRNISALAGSNADIKRVRAFGVGKDLSNPALYEEYCQWVDMDYLIDYLITRTYFADGDIFNQKYWRSKDYTVKWRPVLFDMDFGFSSSSPTRNILGQYFRYDGVPSQDGSITNMDLYCGLKANKEWCERFVKRYVSVVVNHYNAARLTALLDAHAAAMRPEMVRHIKRWGRPSSISSWESAVKSLRDCLEKRPDYALKYLQTTFGVSDADMAAYKQAAQQEQFVLITT